MRSFRRPGEESRHAETAKFEVKLRRSEEVTSWLSERADEMAGLVMELVAIDTENPPGRNLETCAVVLRDAMRRLGFSADLVRLPPARGLDRPVHSTRLGRQRRGDDLLSRTLRRRAGTRSPAV